MYRNETIHIITSSIEHPSILNTCHALENHGIDITYLPVDCNGFVLIKDVKDAINPSTKLVSIMLANNEIGTIQPIAEIGTLLHERGILFHTDAVQAVGHIPVNVKDLQVDFLTASAHKFNGAKGTGILYIKPGLDLCPLIYGGEQEHGLRAGTENVAGIVAAGYALEESTPLINETAGRLNAMVEATIKHIMAKIPYVIFNGDIKNRLPGIINLCFEGASGESLMHLLDLKGICVSTSSACASGNDEPSHVLLALGLSEKLAKSAIRISYGRFNSVDDAETLADVICKAYYKIVDAK